MDDVTPDLMMDEGTPDHMMDEVDSDHLQDQLLDNDVVEGNTSEGTSTRTRGVTTLDKIRKTANIKVDFDPDTGIPIGDGRKSYKNWVCMEAKSKISILEEDRRKIDARSKSFLWSILKRKWNIPDDNAKLTEKIRKYTMKTANQAWRSFKKNLIKYFMDEGKNPCSTYTFITEDTWREFCSRKSTIEFEEKRKIGKALVNMNHNPHHLGSGGYITAKPKWAKALADGKLPEVQGIESERAQDWVMARMPKAGPNNYVIPENIKEITNQIKEREMQATQGSWVPEAGEDVLIAVLGPEHPGRTRGVSHILGVRTTLPSLADKKRRRRDVDELARKVEVQQREIDAAKDRAATKEREFEKEREEARERVARLEARQKQMEEKMQMFFAQQIGSAGSPGVRISSVGSTACLDWIDSLEVTL